MGVQCDDTGGIPVQPDHVIDLTKDAHHHIQVSASTHVDPTNAEFPSVPSGILPADVSQSREKSVSHSPKESIPHAVDATPPDDALFVSSPRIFWIYVQGLQVL